MIARAARTNHKPPPSFALASLSLSLFWRSMRYSECVYARAQPLGLSLSACVRPGDTARLSPVAHLCLQKARFRFLHRVGNRFSPPLSCRTATTIRGRGGKGEGLCYVECRWSVWCVWAIISCGAIRRRSSAGWGGRWWCGRGCAGATCPSTARRWLRRRRSLAAPEWNPPARRRCPCHRLSTVVCRHSATQERV
jgi:hypothetical protein